MRKFELTVLGCGSALPTSKRNPSSQCLNIKEKLFLIDCGEGTQIRLRNQKVRFQRINHIFISHLHGDHYFGLPGLISTMNLLGRQNELHVYGPAGLKEIIMLMMRYSKTYLNFHVSFHETELKTKELLFENDEITVHSFPLKHRIPCSGYLFEEKIEERNIVKKKIKEHSLGIAEIVKLKRGENIVRDNGEVIDYLKCTLEPIPPRSFAYCSDTKYTESIVEYIKGVDLLYHEATFLEELKKRAKSTYHSTAIDAAKIALLAEAKQLLIGHYSSRYTSLDEFLIEAQTVFKETSLSKEGMTVLV